MGKAQKNKTPLLLLRKLTQHSGGASIGWVPKLNAQTDWFLTFLCINVVARARGSHLLFHTTVFTPPNITLGAVMNVSRLYIIN